MRNLSYLFYTLSTIEEVQTSQILYVCFRMRCIGDLRFLTDPSVKSPEHGLAGLNPP